MPSHTRVRLRTAIISTQFAIAAVALGACSSGTDDASATSGWSLPGSTAVSRPAVGGGVAAVTGLAPGGGLQTVVARLTDGKRLWTHDATMAGRLPGMGVEPPAVAGSTVADLEPSSGGVALVAHDATSGRQLWARPESSTYGPAACGAYLCVAEATRGKDARFVAIDPATGTEKWRLPGIAEVEWSDAKRVVVLRMAIHPVLEEHTLSTGTSQWTFPVERALGLGVNLSGGWAFGSLGSSLIGYFAPYQGTNGKNLSAFGFFALRLSDGVQLWARPNLLRLYPSANPAVALLAREVTQDGRYAGFAQLSPDTGQTLSELAATKAPRTGGWWLGFPADLSAIGFLVPGHPGTGYGLRDGNQAGNGTSWSFCTITPTALKITKQPGFYPVAALCAYDLATGRRIADPGPPPGWYTGATDGWRVWRDDQGVLHGLDDANGTSPGMYG